MSDSQAPKVCNQLSFFKSDPIEGQRLSRGQFAYGHQIYLEEFLIRV